MDRETIEIAKRFAKRLRKFEPEKIILFGSRARGTHFKHSDFDFIIVSKKFKNMHFLERCVKVYEYWNEPYDLEAICYTPEEFEKKLKESTFIRKAVREGKEINV